MNTTRVWKAARRAGVLAALAAAVCVSGCKVGPDYVVPEVPVAEEWAQKGADVLGTHPHCRYAALGYGDWALTVQAHPEYYDDFLRGLMEMRGKGVVPDALMAAAETRMGQPSSSAAIAARIAEFFKKHES